MSADLSDAQYLMDNTCAAIMAVRGKLRLEPTWVAFNPEAWATIVQAEPILGQRCTVWGKTVLPDADVADDAGVPLLFHEPLPPDSAITARDLEADVLRDLAALAAGRLP